MKTLRCPFCGSLAEVEKELDFNFLMKCSECGANFYTRIPYSENYWKKQEKIFNPSRR